MNFKVCRVDMAKVEATWPREVPFAPAYVQKRPPGDTKKWLVLAEPIVPGTPPLWSLSEHDEYVRIPLFPYLLSPEADLALAFMLQLGLSCASHLTAAVASFYVVTGVPVEILYDPDTDTNVNIRCWIGFAVDLEK